MPIGISTEYYTRLEQGRARCPSAQVLDAVARALQLDAETTTHLHALADPVPGRCRASRRVERIRPSLAQLIDTWHDTPAYIEGRYLDILAANPIAITLSPIFAPGSNVLRSVLLNPAAPDVVPDWENGVAALVALLRSTAGADLDAPRLTELVGELSLKNDLFRRLWSSCGSEATDTRTPLSGTNNAVLHQLSQFQVRGVLLDELPGQVRDIAVGPEPGRLHRGLELLGGQRRTRERHPRAAVGVQQRQQ